MLNDKTQGIIHRLEAVKYDGSFDPVKIQKAFDDYFRVLNLPIRPVEIHKSLKKAIAAWTATWDEAWAVALNAPRDAAWDVARDAARDAAWDATWDPTWDAARWDEAWAAALNAARATAWDVARAAAWATAWDTTGDAAWDTTGDAAWAAAIANSLYDHPEYDKLVAPFHCCIALLEAKVGLFWVQKEKVICVPFPAMQNGFGNLHCEDGPAVLWDDQSFWFVEGVKVDEQIVMRPETQTIKQINSEINEEVKRVRLSRFGMQRYLEESNAKVLDVNVASNWMEALMLAGDIVALCTYDPSTGRQYVLEVDPTCKSCADAQRYLLAPEIALDGLEVDPKTVKIYPVWRT